MFLNQFDPILSCKLLLVVNQNKYTVHFQFNNNKYANLNYFLLCKASIIRVCIGSSIVHYCTV